MGWRRPVLLVLLIGSILLPNVPATAAQSTVVQGPRGAVAAEHRLASAAGVAILRAGGNAVDAAVATALAGGVVNPSSSGLGGGGFMLVYLADAGRAHAIDFRERAPAAAERLMFVDGDHVDTTASKRGGRAIGVPGEPAGLQAALQRFGTMTMAQVAQPAIRLAAEGFEVEHHLAATIASKRDAIAADPALAAEFLHPDGKPYREGEKLVRPGLASTLQLLAEQGTAAFYDGRLAGEIVDAARASGGILTRADLRTYRPVYREPVVVHYKRWQLLGMPPPSSGGGVIGEILGVLEPYPLHELGHNSVTYLHLLAGAMKAAFADRALLYGDPDFVDVPLARLLSPDHAASIRRHLSATHTVPASTYGNGAGRADAGTAHLSVIDAAGNAVALTTSINTGFGSKVGVPSRGIVLNNTMDDFSLRPGVPNAYGLIGSEANSIAGDKRPLSSMSPTLVLQDGHLRMALGASGGPLIISATLQTFLNVAEFGMDLGKAIDAPRIHHQWQPDRLAVEAGISDNVRKGLTRRGHHLVTLSHGAAVQAVEVIATPDGRRVRAASDARKGGLAAAE